MSPRQATLVAFQGQRGAFGERAIRQVWGPRVITVAVLGFGDVVKYVAEGRVDAGVLPVENAIVGAIEESRAALARVNGIEVVGETVVAIDLAVMAVPGVALDDLLYVSSHAVALAQCSKWLAARPWIHPVAVFDTAGAACMLAEHRHRQSAAIASVAAADYYGLSVLDDRVADREGNATRFVVIARQDAGVSRGRLGTSQRLHGSARDPR